MLGAVTLVDSTRTESLERVETCPICAGRERVELPTPNLNSRDAARSARLRAALGDDFFVHQRIAFCLGCDHVFQHLRPTDWALGRLYDRFAKAVAKVTPSAEQMVHYLLVDNAQDYVHFAAKTEHFLDRVGALDGARSALEIRTYGGSLCALLRERGVEHVEAAHISDFDAAMARSLFGLEHTVPFSYAEPIEQFSPCLERYDLIVLSEGLTHSKDPAALLGWLGERLAPGGTVLLQREPNTPRYRRLFSLAAVFNNFHMNLLNLRTLDALLSRSTDLPHTFAPEWHPNYAHPLYVNVLIGAGAEQARARHLALEPADEQRYPLDYYRSWIRWEADPGLATALKIGRAVSRISSALGKSVRDEVPSGAVERIRRRVMR